MLRDPATRHSTPRHVQRTTVDFRERTHEVSEPVGSTRGFIHEAAIGMHLAPRGSALNRHACVRPFAPRTSRRDLHDPSRRVVDRGAGWTNLLSRIS